MNFRSDLCFVTQFALGSRSKIPVALLSPSHCLRNMFTKVSIGIRSWGLKNTNVQDFVLICSHEAQLYVSYEVINHRMKNLKVG